MGKGVGFWKVLKSFWFGFNHWRKKHWPFRLIIFILAGCPLLLDYAFFGEHVVVMLIRTAIRSIEYSSQSKVSNAWLRYNHTVEKRRLQVSLMKIERQLSRETVKQLHKPAFKSDLKILFSSAKKHGTIPKCSNLRQMKRTMLAGALYETEKRFRPEYKSVYSMLDTFSNLDYSKWSTWQKGINKYCIYMLCIIFPETLVTSLSWMFLCFFTGSIIYLISKRFRKIKSVVICSIITFAIFTISYLSRRGIDENTISGLIKAWLYINTYNISVLVYLLYSSAMALLGCWFAEKYLTRISPKQAVYISLYGLGISLIAASFYITMSVFDFYFPKLFFNINMVIICAEYVQYIILCLGMSVIGITAYNQLTEISKK